MQKSPLRKLSETITRFAVLGAVGFALIGPRSVLGDNCVTPPSGLVGWWPGNGNTVDYAGNRSGNLINGANYAPGQVGAAFSLSSAAYISVADNAALRPAQLTLEAWVYPKSLRSGSWDTIISHGAVGGGALGSSSDTYFLSFYDGKPDFETFHAVSGGDVLRGKTSLPPNQWYHLVATFDGTNKSLYVNGTLLTNSVINHPLVYDVGAPFVIGEDYNSGSAAGIYFTGLIDEPSIYNRALAAGEVQALYNAGTAGKCGAGAGGASVPYLTDFEAGVGPEWTVPQWSTTETLGFTRFTGRFDNSPQTLVLTNLVPGVAYTLGFDFYALDSLDGGSINGGDLFNVAINSVNVFQNTFDNYNSEPPNGSQTYPGRPDEGRANFGFTPGFVDAIYRNIQINFTASNSFAAISFYGQNLQTVDDESWGLDNVSVVTSASITNTFVRSTSLPPSGSTNAVPIENFTVSANYPLLATSATNAANFSLRDAGNNGILGDDDDVLHPMALSLPGPGGRSIAFNIANGPLQAGRYRFQSTAGLLDTNSTSLPAFTRDFVIVNPVLGQIEFPNDDILAGATTLPAVESPAGSGFFTGFGTGTFSSTSDVDFWRFDAEAGDVVSVRLESESQGVYPNLYLQNASGQNLATYGGDYNGVTSFQNISISTPGSYFLRVFSNNNRSRYSIRLDISRGGPQLESEANDTQSTANPVNLAFSTGLYQGRVAGALPAADTAGDYYRLGNLNVGNSINLSALFPLGSTLNATNIVLSVQLAGNNVDLVTNQTGNLNYTVVADGAYFVHVQTTNPGLRSQYLLNVTMVDGVPPLIAACTLPAEGTTNNSMITRFNLTFSEDILSSSVSNSANYELRNAGADGAFGTSDDTTYNVTVDSQGYTSGLTGYLTLIDGPLQPGSYRFTATGLKDRANNAMSAPFIRNFAVTGLPGFVQEGRTHSNPGTATPLNFAATTNGDGTFSPLNASGTALNPQGMASGYFNSDTNLDIVTANYGANNITVLLGDGHGGFQSTNIATGGGAVSVAVGDFNGDNKSDLAVANYNAGTISILLGDGNGNFTIKTNIPGFSNPYYLMTMDFNHDNKLDLAVPNAGNGTITVLLGNGDGTFRFSTNYTTGSSPISIAGGDLNNDNQPDLVVVNSGNSTLTLLLGNGDGTFHASTNLPTVGGPRAVAIADLTGDGIPDLVVAQPGNSTIGVFPGKGDGTFLAERNYTSPSASVYSLAVVDFNRDGKLDVVEAGYGNNVFTVFLNDGAGTLTNAYNYGLAGNPIGIVTGDFDSDGIVDLAFCEYTGNIVSIWSGNPTTFLGEDPAGSGLRTASARGSRGATGEVHYYQFSANAGDQAIIAVDVPGNPAASGLNYQLLRADGSSLFSFNADYYGWGQSGVFTIPSTGTYLVRVAQNYDYQGEYRFRVTLARPPLQLQTEGANTSIANATTVSLTRATNHLVASVAGYLGVGNGSGDYYYLGNLLGGSTVTLKLGEPATSQLGAILWVYNGAGVLLTNSAAGSPSLVFKVPVGQDAGYYVRITGSTLGYTGATETALHFSGGSDSVDLGTWFTNQAFTISMWVNPGASQTTYADIIDNNHNSTIGWVVEQNGNSINQYTWGCNDGATAIPFTLQANAWQHLTITRDSTNINRVYLNGVLVGSAAGSRQINYGGSPFLRLARWAGGGRNWNGYMDEVRLWGHDLSPAEVAASVIGSLNGNEPDLLGYYRFNEGFGSASADSSTGGHLATLVNSPGWTFLAPSNDLPAGLLSQYLLSFDITNGATPQITSVTLPAGANSTNLITSFTVGFNEDMDGAFALLSRPVQSFGGHSYLITTGLSSWPAAEAQAVSIGGHLVTINNQAENDWVRQTFAPYGDLWIGFTDQVQEGNFVWASGEPVTYTHWNGGEPNNSGGAENWAELYASSGFWNDVSIGGNLRGVIEFNSTLDSDGDGLPDVLDPYPNDPLNAFDLRAAGPDGNFDTADDIIYRVVSTGYSSGLSAGFQISNGPLQPGNYRFMVTTALKDRFGNALQAAYNQYFTITGVSGFVTQARRGTSGTSTTSLSSAPASQLDGSFTSFTNYNTPPNPYNIAQGNLNGDTNLDLVTANYGGNNITLWMGDGTGSFTATTNVATGAGALAVVISDFNGDGKSDLAVANYSANTVSILLGDGLGNFQLVTNYPGFNQPYNLVAADFNHDNKMDLAVVNYGANTITVMLGGGNGTFTNVSYPAGSNPESIASGDLNGDNQPDLVVANSASSTLGVYFGNTNGTFQIATNLANGSRPRAVAVADLNGDGFQDIVSDGASGVLSVYLNAGNGTFLPRVDYPFDNSDVYQLQLADLNGDGKPDVVIPAYGNNSLVTVLNNGDGTFGSANYYNPGGNPIAVTVGDFNHDGRQDIASANYSGFYITVLLGNATQTLQTDPAGTGLRMVAARGNLADGSDLDYWTFSAQAGDLLNFAVENPGNPVNSSLTFRIYRPDGSQWAAFSSEQYGRGQTAGTLPTTGTYTIRVEPNNQYYGEYRFRLTLARPPVQLEIEDNSSLNAANTPVFSFSPGHQKSTQLGYIGSADGSGDFYRLGNLPAGTAINLHVAKPATSGLLSELYLYNAAGNVVAVSRAGVTDFTYLIPTGSNGAYFAQIWDAGPFPALPIGGVDGYSLRFDGGSTWVAFTNGIIPSSGDFTVECWAYGLNVGNYHELITQGSGGNAFYLGFVGNNIRSGDGWQDTGVPFPFNGWHHFALVKSSTNTLLFVDGLLANSKGSTIPNPAATDNLRFGRQYDGYGEYWPGSMDEVRIWNVARTASDIQTSRSNRLSGAESGLVGYWRFDEGTNSILFDATAFGRNGTVQSQPIWVSSTITNVQPSSIFSQYLLSIDLASTISPQIVSVSLPDEGSTTSNIVDRFSITFSEDMAPATITNTAYYELRSAGPDNNFGTSDDLFYPVLNNPAYSSGVTASYFLQSSPLQPGKYRFTISTNLADLPGNNLTNAYVRNFSISDLPGYVLESRTNNSGAQATSLSRTTGNLPDGSFRVAGAIAPVQSSPYYIVSGQIDGDTNLDLAVANYSSSSVSILLGDGSGNFTLKTNVPAGPNAICPVLGKFDGDNTLDLAVANYGNQTVSIFTGLGDGNFLFKTNYAVGDHPIYVVSADFDHDGRMDLAVANVNGGTVSVLLGNGDGTFRPPSNYPVGAGPTMLAVGDLNSDGKPDLVVVNQTSDTISLLLGNGNGTFAPAISLATGRTPRALALGYINGDTNLDLVVFNAVDNTFNIMFGNGDGSFQPRIELPAGTSDGYQIALGDFNSDGLTDLAVTGYGNAILSVTLNRGNGQFESPAIYGMPYNVVGLVAGDFNNDGTLDLVAGNYSSTSITALFGQRAQPLTMDAGLPGIRMAAGRGNISDGSDVDFYTFTAQAGDLLQFATDSPGNYSGSGQYFTLYRPDGGQITAMADYYGRNQLNTVLSSSGTYTIRVSQYYNYSGEYRFRVSLARPPLQLEGESNDSIGAANVLSFTNSAGHRLASVLGYLGTADTAGDFFALGNLSAGAIIKLNNTQPATSPLLAVLGIYNSAGTLLTNTTAGASSLVFITPTPDAYFARIQAGSSSADLMSVYTLNLEVVDATSPAVTAVNLPPNGTTNQTILDRFSVTLSKDVSPAINNLNRYTRIYGGHGYTITTGPTSWYSAESQARSLGGHLASINDPAENAWVNANFSSFGNVWIGLSDEAQKNFYVWSGGDSLIYTNWNTGQPNNASDQDYVALLTSGVWSDYGAGTSFRGVIEIAGPDSDGDGIPDAIDPYPYDPFNLADLRTAGPDGVFDTADDQIYHLNLDNYTGGLNLNFYVIDGPLQAGNYRFTITGSLQDNFGNSLGSPSVRYFSIGDVAGYTLAGRTNNTAQLATPLAVTEDPPGIKNLGARGKLYDGNDADFWSFTGTAGDLVTLSVDSLGEPYASRLYYQMTLPDGTLWFNFVPGSVYGFGQYDALTLPATGTYHLRITPYDGYYSEYRFRLTMVTPPLQLEAENNSSIATGNPLTLTTSGNTRSTSVSGYLNQVGDLDYFNLGTVTNGYSIYLSIREPAGSTITPVVSIYNAANAYQAEAPGGRPDDGVAEVRITKTDTYYALVRDISGASGLDSRYVLDVQVVPTGTVNFPNLVVSAVNLPTDSSILSGQTITYSYGVQNIGSLATPSPNWSDRAALSLDTVLGNSDDLALGVFPHNGSLNPGESYLVTNSYKLPDGLSGDFHLIINADSGNSINEFLFESDNVSASPSTFHVGVAPYPDLVVENLAINGPTGNGVYTITWDTANRGTALAPAGFQERFVVRNLTTGLVLTNVEQAVNSILLPNATVPHTATVATTNGGNYQVVVATDSQNAVFEYNVVSHGNAEANNTSSIGFQIVTFFTVAAQTSPGGAGLLNGTGQYASGATVSLTATPITNTLPYIFVNWTEDNAFQSANSNYLFVISGDRHLVANFTLPSYQVSASNNPPTAGTVAGQGTYFHGATNVLTAVSSFGYRFSNWTQNGNVISLAPSLTNIITSNAFFVANYVEANTLHVVTTATSPTNLATVAGAGSYTNGQIGNFSTPVSITNPPNIYTFNHYLVNGASAGNSAIFNKTFSTLDPTNLQYVATYTSISILPLVIGTSQNLPNTVPATTNFILSLQFNRSMDTNFPPLVVLTNPTAPIQATVPLGGTWTTNASANDTFTLPAITFTTGMDGTNAVLVSQARDQLGSPLTRTNVLNIVVDVTPPANPILSLTASNSSSATISWSAYVAPADLNSFRVYVSTTNFGAVTGLPILTGLGSGARNYQINGLQLDTTYFAALQAVDQAGNSSPLVTTLAFKVPSSLPPPVSVQAPPMGASSALLSWSSYDTSSLLGFAGFRVYYETTDFATVAGLTSRATLASGIRTLQVDDLDRTKTYHFAVVGYNVTNGFNPNVVTATWADPFAGTISANTTIGGSGTPIVDILHSITIVNNAVLTIPAGTTLRFAPGAGVLVQQGSISAVGTPLDPIILDSANDQAGFTPAPGDWNGITLADGGGASVLRHVFVKFGAGLTLSNASPVVDAFTALNNLPVGLNLAGNAHLNTTNALLINNGIGAQQQGTAQLAILNSVIKNNGTNAFALGANPLSAQGDWWGSANGADVAAGVQGPVTTNNFLISEPLLTPAIGTVGNVTQVGSRSVNLRLACRTADSMRLSEDSTFTAVFYSPFTNNTQFQLSEGGGAKTVFAQFRSVTGQTSAPVSVTINYITAGPTITSFSLVEGQVLNRPSTVTGNATAPLGVADLEFYLDGVALGTNVGSSFSILLDVRSFSSGIHRVELLARDHSGNLATASANVVFAPTPPPAPLIITPVTDLVVNTPLISLSGTAEPLIELKLFNSGSLLADIHASAAGTFGFPNQTLLEGANAFAVQAVDSIGTANSQTRTVTLDTLPPVQLILDPPIYRPGIGLSLTWHFPDTGKRANAFEVCWSTTPITDLSQATGHTAILNLMSTTVQGLATGNYYFYVVGFDSIGNKSPLSLAAPIYFDAIPPTFTVAYDKPSPVGVGPVMVTINSSEPLSGTPVVTIQPSGSAPAVLTLTNSALNTYSGGINVTTLLPSGTAVLNLVGQDLAGNSFSGPPAGPALVIDVTPPAGSITTVPLPPIQATNTTNITVSLQLSKPAQPGQTPVLNFGPPIGAPVPVVLTGFGTNWSGSLAVTPGMGSGIGHFTMTVSDSLGNIGHSLNSGSELEIYNTALPSPPGQPVGFHVSSLSGGRVQLNWNSVPNADIYRVYSQPGTNFLLTPTNLVADNLSSNSFIDLPSTDGFFLYAVTASRRGSDGTNSITRIALSDRTPPPMPVSVAAQLAATGVQISWQAGVGEPADHYNIYRNGTLIRTVNAIAPVIDNPPRGVINYVVSAADALGNEATSIPATFQSLVGAVGNLQALVSTGLSPTLSWVSTDNTAVGFNIYRNGIKQNAALLNNQIYNDPLTVGIDPVTYSITALNSTNGESAARSVVVYPASVSMLPNLSPNGTTTNSPQTLYFDDYRVTVSNFTASAALPLQQLEVQRTAPGADPFSLVTAVNLSIAANSSLTQDIAVPCAFITAAQTVRVRAVQQTDSQGSSVIYEKLFGLPTVQPPGVMLDVGAFAQPLAGGLSAFSVRIYNRGYAPMYFAAVRGNGAQPGDLYISVLNPQGQEVGRTTFSGTPPGIIFAGDTGYVRIAPGASTSLVVSNVLVPASLASNLVTFQAVVSAIYDRAATSGQLQSGPLNGSMQSSLSQTPYFGAAQTDQSLYNNDQAIIISGQSLDRLTQQPVPNSPLKVGFSTRGYRWYQDVTTDSNGHFSYSYSPPAGFAGTLNIWAAHPDVFDQLNQAQVTVYRLYANPSGGEIRMSKNDTLPFSITLINPGDVDLTGFTVGFQAYQMVGTNQVPINSIHGTGLFDTNLVLNAGQQHPVLLQLQSDPDAPDNAIAVFTLASAQGASVVFRANVTLLPAVPILSVVNPNVGYVEASVNRGSLLSAQVTIANSGQKDLLGVTLQPPTNITWMNVNLPASSDGAIHLPDLKIGQSNSFTVIFLPPTNTVLGSYHDLITIAGTNAQAAFPVNLYVKVTSSKVGALQFYVDDILGLDVPNATVRLRNTALQVELPVVQTDINGLVTVTNLQEGDWSWQVSAPGHSANVGVATVVADQVVNVATRLNASVVTVNFTVVPVPFTDRYDIVINQTYETHVPLPVLVLTPTYRSFDNVTPGFQASFTVNAKNAGLIQMENVTIVGSQNDVSTFTPLINYLPVLLPQQSVDIPFTVTYLVTNAPGRMGGVGDALLDCLPNPFDLANQIADFINGLNALMNAEGRCIKDNTLIAIAGSVAITLTIYNFVSGAAALLTLAPEAIASYLGCVIGTLLAGLFGNLGNSGSSGPAQSSVQNFQNGGPECFAAETRVLLADGRFKTINEIKTGDVVRTGRESFNIAPVAETHTRLTEAGRAIRFELASGKCADELHTTDEHLFWVDGHGWTPAIQLKKGDWLFNEKGQRLHITSNERIREPLQVYTFKLQGDTAFYANGVLVHDLCGNWTPDLPSPAGLAPLARPPPLNTAK